MGNKQNHDKSKSNLSYLCFSSETYEGLKSGKKETCSKKSDQKKSNGAKKQALPIENVK